MGGMPHSESRSRAGETTGRKPGFSPSPTARTGRTCTGSSRASTLSRKDEKQNQDHDDAPDRDHQQIETDLLPQFTHHTAPRM